VVIIEHKKQAVRKRTHTKKLISFYIHAAVSLSINF